MTPPQSNDELHAQKEKAHLFIQAFTQQLLQLSHLINHIERGPFRDALAGKLLELRDVFVAGLSEKH